MKTRIVTKEDLDTLHNKGVQSLFPGRIKFSVQMGTCGKASGAEKIYNIIEKTIQNTDLLLTATGCIGLCEKEPMVNVFIPGYYPVVYCNLDEESLGELLPQWIEGRLPSANSLMQLDGTVCAGNGNSFKQPEGICRLEEVPFFKPQKKIALQNSGLIDPLNLEEYIGRGGYYPLFRVLTDLTPDNVVDCISDSGLRGRGGGGFLTGRKWRSCRNAPGEPKYIICNADEGDPGAYMDRTVIEGDPFRILEGMAIGAYGIGSSEGYIYVRAEYPLAVETLTQAIETAREYGLLGDHIFGTNFSFDVSIKRGGGAFVCGESTALMASIEGKVGEPRVKHIHTVVSGFREKPTVLNNVETWANVPSILSMGSGEFRKIGTEGSAGTKVFSVVGKINNNGLVEVPMGITLKEIIFDIGGGIPLGKKFKAVQTGGPSGGCIPETFLDMPVDFDELIKAGSMMGSGGMIVMDEDTCMVDIARYFLSFLLEESCGKCTPCREGTYQLFQIVNRITEGKGKEEDIPLLEELSEMICDTSLCALGKTAPNPVLSTLKYFRDEYEAHIKDKKCPAGVCKALIEYRILPDTCTACGKCRKACPYDAIQGEKKEPHRIIKEKCTKCGICFDICPFDAIIKV